MPRLVVEADAMEEVVEETNVELIVVEAHVIVVPWRRSQSSWKDVVQLVEADTTQLGRAATNHHHGIEKKHGRRRNMALRRSTDFMRELKATWC
jgi:virulence-associated protein VagC